MKQSQIINRWITLRDAEKNAVIWFLLNDDIAKFDNPFDVLLRCRHVDKKVLPHAGYPTNHINPEPYCINIDSAWAVWMRLVENGRCPALHEGYDDTDGGDIAIWINLVNPASIDVKGRDVPDTICLVGLLAEYE